MRKIWKCDACDRIIIRNSIRLIVFTPQEFCAPPICVCDSDYFTEMSEKELRKLKLKQINETNK